MKALDVDYDRVVIGYYKADKPYTTKPHITRCIDNNDFGIIKSIFI